MKGSAILNPNFSDPSSPVGSAVESASTIVAGDVAVEAAFVAAELTWVVVILVMAAEAPVVVVVHLMLWNQLLQSTGFIVDTELVPEDVTVEPVNELVEPNNVDPDVVAVEADCVSVISVGVLVVAPLIRVRTEIKT